MAASPALAQTSEGFVTPPAFSWFEPDPTATGAPRWEGSYARLSSGFEVVSSRHFGSYGGPTIGFEGGKMLRDGDVVFGIVGAVDYLAPTLGVTTPTFGRIGYSRDFAGALDLKVGRFVADDVLVYTKLGAAAVNQTFRFGPTPASLPFSRSDLALVPDARVGVEWAITDRTSVSLEVGVARAPFH